MEFLQREELAMDTLSTDAPITPLRQRMQQDMLMRGLGPHTQQDYIRHVRRFAAFLRRSPETATPEDISRFQLHRWDQQLQAWSEAASPASRSARQGARRPAR